MIKVWQSGVDHEDLRRVIHAVNYSEVVLAFPVSDATEDGAVGGGPAGAPGNFGIAGRTFEGFSVDRSFFRTRLPDARWFLYAAGFVNPGDANTGTVSLVYQKNDTTTVTIGSVTAAGAGFVKKALGPFDLFATVGVPATESIVTVRLKAQKNIGDTGQLTTWTIWLRLLPPKL